MLLVLDFYLINPLKKQTLYSEINLLSSKTMDKTQTFEKASFQELKYVG